MLVLNVRRIPSPVPTCDAYRLNECTVFVGQEPMGPGGALRWHLYISHPTRYPSWDEIHEARYRFVPDAACMAIILPPKDEYVNVHPNCFHLHEIEAGDRPLRRVLAL